MGAVEALAMRRQRVEKGRLEMVQRMDTAVEMGIGFSIGYRVLVDIKRLALISVRYASDPITFALFQLHGNNRESTSVGSKA